MLPDNDVVGVRLQLAEIKGMLTRAHLDYDRRIEVLEKSQSGLGGRMAQIISPIISGAALLLVLVA
ncbi:hypothetical protein [Glutamicibacter sp. NPDC087673]|uniref:hypothetical protein n=1 Tax=Glutamicibacter sp. NPDC087673 TaxID=3363997 RepID=UPI003828B3F8